MGFLLRLAWMDLGQNAEGPLNLWSRWSLTTLAVKQKPWLTVRMENLSSNRGESPRQVTRDSSFFRRKAKLTFAASSQVHCCSECLTVLCGKGIGLKNNNHLRCHGWCFIFRECGIRKCVSAFQKTLKSKMCVWTQERTSGPHFIYLSCGGHLATPHQFYIQNWFPLESTVLLTCVEHSAIVSLG